jgi:hypothetical protein
MVVSLVFYCFFPPYFIVRVAGPIEAANREGSEGIVINVARGVQV